MLLARAQLRPRPLPAALTLTGAVVAVLSGCAAPNDGLSVADRVALEALSPGAAQQPFPKPRPAAGDAPSLRADSLDRAHWAVRPILVPIDGTAHQPTYATGPSYARSTPRQRGEFPTLDSVLDLGDRESAWAEVYEGFAWPFWAGVDLALMPARMVMHEPWSTVQSPTGPRARAPLGTQTPAQLGAATPAAVPVMGTIPTVPPVDEPRWIWRDGKWYLWTPGDPEPWLPPPPPPPTPAPTPGAAPDPAPAATPGSPAGSPTPAPAPAVPAEARPHGSGGWIFKDGKWIRTTPAPTPAPDAPRPAEPKP
ncbi:MAG: hypothetical protein JNK35_00190 [Phycisphaerae bacterium]|nr:hypothetical protein [Phycisphaerae bacterium]